MNHKGRLAKVLLVAGALVLPASSAAVLGATTAGALTAPKSLKAQFVFLVTPVNSSAKAIENCGSTAILTTPVVLTAVPGASVAWTGGTSSARVTLHCSSGLTSGTTAPGTFTISGGSSTVTMSIPAGGISQTESGVNISAVTFKITTGDSTCKLSLDSPTPLQFTGTTPSVLRTPQAISTLLSECGTCDAYSQIAGGFVTGQLDL